MAQKLSPWHDDPNIVAELIPTPGNVWQDEEGTIPARFNGDPVRRIKDSSGGDDFVYDSAESEFILSRNATGGWYLKSSSDHSRFVRITSTVARPFIAFCGSWVNVSATPNMRFTQFRGQVRDPTPWLFWVYLGKTYWRQNGMQRVASGLPSQVAAIDYLRNKYFIDGSINTANLDNVDCVYDSGYTETRLEIGSREGDEFYGAVIIDGGNRSDDDFTKLTNWNDLLRSYTPLPLEEYCQYAQPLSPWHDDSNIVAELIPEPGYVWQDEEGTIPAIVDGDPVKRIRDRSGGVDFVYDSSLNEFILHQNDWGGWYLSSAGYSQFVRITSTVARPFIAFCGSWVDVSAVRFTQFRGQVRDPTPWLFWVYLGKTYWKQNDRQHYAVDLPSQVAAIDYLRNKYFIDGSINTAYLDNVDCVYDSSYTETRLEIGSCEGDEFYGAVIIDGGNRSDDDFTKLTAWGDLLKFPNRGLIADMSVQLDPLVADFRAEPFSLVPISGVVFTNAGQPADRVDVFEFSLATRVSTSSVDAEGNWLTTAKKNDRVFLIYHANGCASVLRGPYLVAESGLVLE